jgi:hypothetical protein
MKTPEDEAFEEIERIQRTRTRWVPVEKPQDDWAKPTPAEYAMGYAEGFNDACKPNYTAPPQRTWVGLEQSDMPDGEDPMFDHEYFIAGMVYADKVLKEKNT